MLLPLTKDPTNRMAVRSCYGDLVCVANSEEHADFILRACNAPVLPPSTKCPHCGYVYCGILCPICKREPK